MDLTVDDILVILAFVFVVVVVFRLYVQIVRRGGNALREGNGNQQQQHITGANEANNNNNTNNTHNTTGPLQSPTANRAEIEEFARQQRSSNANRRADERARTDRFNDEDHECSVCLCEAEAAVEFLPCGHTFCGKCAQQLWRHGGVVRRMCCPLDRSEVEAIVPEFKMREAFAGRARQRGEALGLSVGETRQIDIDLARYNTHNTQRSLRGMVQLVARSFTLARFMPFLIQFKIFCLFVGPFLYTIAPIDIIPEVIFGLVGYIDDIVIILVAMIALAGIARRALGMRE